MESIAAKSVKAFLKDREKLGTKYIDPVVDTSVLIDMFDPSSPRHEKAKILGDFLINNRLKAYVPWTAMFELNSVFIRLRKTTPEHQLSDYFGEERPVILERIPIDAEFFKKYFVADLPYTKAADKLFLSIAHVDARPLITEDKKLRKAARAINILAYTIEEYLYCVKDEQDENDPLQVWVKMLKCSCQSHFVEKVAISDETKQDADEALVVFVALISVIELPDMLRFLRERLNASQMQNVKSIDVATSETKEVTQEVLVIFTERISWDKASALVSSLREVKRKAG